MRVECFELRAFFLLLLANCVAVNASLSSFFAQFAHTVANKQANQKNTKKHTKNNKITFQILSNKASKKVS
jgi:hypothetical protein